MIVLAKGEKVAYTLIQITLVHTAHNLICCMFLGEGQKGIGLKQDSGPNQTKKCRCRGLRKWFYGEHIKHICFCFETP